MQKEILSVQQTRPRRGIVAHLTSSRLLTTPWTRNLCIAVGLMILLLLVEFILLLVFGPTKNLSLFFLNSIHNPLLLLLPLLDLFLVFVLVWAFSEPLLIFLYLLGVAQERDSYNRIYTPLSAKQGLHQVSAVPYFNEDESYDAQNVLSALQHSGKNELLLGLPGAGKTIVLMRYEYAISQEPWKVAMGRSRLPVYVPIKNYTLFVQSKAEIEPLTGDACTDEGPLYEQIASDLGQISLLRFLQEEGAPFLRSSIARLVAQGQVVFLCDGLNEVDNLYLSLLCAELSKLMYESNNRVIMTCREADFREELCLSKMVTDQKILPWLLYPLKQKEIEDFVHRYVEVRQPEPDPQMVELETQECMEVIEHSRLRYLCTNPMMLFTLMQIIDEVGIARPREIDTRGLLLQTFVTQLFQKEEHKPQWEGQAPDLEETLFFLSALAFAARLDNTRNAIQLPGSTLIADEEEPLSLDDLAINLSDWMLERVSEPPFVDSEDQQVQQRSVSFDPFDIPQFLRFAQATNLVEITGNGVLSFRHELIAEYFVARYFYELDQYNGNLLLLHPRFLEDVPRWSEPVAIWAGLLEDPMDLADRLARLGTSDQEYIYQALVLSLMCVGVQWTPVDVARRKIVLPNSVRNALGPVVLDKELRERVADIFKRCANEGGLEVYRSLLPLLTIRGIDELLLLLDQRIVPEQLFEYLLEEVEDPAQDTLTKALVRVLSRFSAVNGTVLPRAIMYASSPDIPIPLRLASLNILGGSRNPQAVEPLVQLLGDPQNQILKQAANDLMRLGPDLALLSVIDTFEGNTTPKVQWAALMVLVNMLDQPRRAREVNDVQYQQIIESLIRGLSSNYVEQINERAMQELEKHGKGSVDEKRMTLVRSTLAENLATVDETQSANLVRVLIAIGRDVLPLLVQRLRKPSKERMRITILEIFRELPDPVALPATLQLLADPSKELQQYVNLALHSFVPACIPPLIDMVLTYMGLEVARRAENMLAEIGQPVVEPVSQRLTPVVPDRTLLLVELLGVIKAPEVIPRLVNLLHKPEVQQDVDLLVQIVTSLGSFYDVQVVKPLLGVLRLTDPEAVNAARQALIRLRELPLPDLLRALDNEEAPFTARVREIITALPNFPMEQLLRLWEQGSALQMAQVDKLFLLKQDQVAPFLVEQLLNHNEDISDYAYRMLLKMDGIYLVPPLVNVLDDVDTQNEVEDLLLHHPEEAIPELIELMGDGSRDHIAKETLPRFGEQALPFLVAALDDPRPLARTNAALLIQLLMQKDPELIPELITFFNPAMLGLSSLPPMLYEGLMMLLTQRLYPQSRDPLLVALEDENLMPAASDALVRLMREEDGAETLNDLLYALRSKNKRRGAMMSLVEMGDKAAVRLTELIADPDPDMAEMTQHILSEMGAPVLPYIWLAYSDVSNQKKQQAALNIFRNLPTEAFKDSLVAQLVDKKSNQMTAMALALLMVRAHEEALLPFANQELVPSLLEYIQVTGERPESLRVVASLLILCATDPETEQSVIGHLLRLLSVSNHSPLFTRALLLLGNEVEPDLLDLVHSDYSTPRVRSEAAGLLGQMVISRETYQELQGYIATMGEFDLTESSADMREQEYLNIALRILGGFLASGRYNVSTLQEQLEQGQSEAEQELYSFLLGRRYTRSVEDLEKVLDMERRKHHQEIERRTREIGEKDHKIKELNDELLKMLNERNSVQNSNNVVLDENIKLKEQNELLKRRIQYQEQRFPNPGL